MIEKVEEGKLYKSYWGGIYECKITGVGNLTTFKRISLDPTFGDQDYQIHSFDLMHEIEREATVEDIENAMEAGLENIEGLRDAIAQERKALEKLDEWRDRLD